MLLKKLCCENKTMVYLINMNRNSHLQKENRAIDRKKRNENPKYS